jgi:hypothetical protein
MATKTRRRLRFPVTEFIVQHSEAAAMGLKLHEFAKRAGLTYSAVTMRLHALRQRGVVLPRLKHGLLGKPGNRSGKGTGKIARSVVVAAGRTARITNRSSKSITITIGG